MLTFGLVCIEKWIRTTTTSKTTTKMTITKISKTPAGISPTCKFPTLVYIPRDTKTGTQNIAIQQNVRATDVTAPSLPTNMTTTTIVQFSRARNQPISNVEIGTRPIQIQSKTPAWYTTLWYRQGTRTTCRLVTKTTTTNSTRIKSIPTDCIKTVPPTSFQMMLNLKELLDREKSIQWLWKHPNMCQKTQPYQT